jgi:hypothetical protein
MLGFLLCVFISFSLLSDIIYWNSCSLLATCTMGCFVDLPVCFQCTCSSVNFWAPYLSMTIPFSVLGMLLFIISYCLSFSFNSYGNSTLCPFCNMFDKKSFFKLFRVISNRNTFCLTTKNYQTLVSSHAISPGHNTAC